MKLYRKPKLYLATALVGLWLLSALQSLAFYNPAEGRWLSRDPVEEEGGANLYSLAENACVGKVDPVGHKTITIGFGFDTSARATRETLRTISEGLAFLERMLIHCVQESDCGCQQTDAATIGVRQLYDFKSNIPAPESGIYDLDTRESKALMLKNIGLVNTPGVRVLVTRSAITETWRRERIGAAATTEPGVGILYNVSWPNTYVLAHELGHFTGYVGDADGDPFHARDPNNLMHLHGGNTPDCQWCQKMDALAQ